MQAHRHLRWVAGLAGTLLAVAPAGPATAQSDQAPAPPPGFSLSVSPARLVVPAEQIGQEFHLTVTNRGGEPAQIFVRHRDVLPEPDGTIRFVADAPYSALPWVTTTPSEFQLAPGQSQPVTVRVDLPEVYEPGDHHLAVLFVSPATGGGNLRINRSIGVPVYIQAPGTVDRSVVLTALRAPRFAVRGPVDLTASLEHVGTVHRNFRGAEQLAIDTGRATVPLPEFTVLRDATREVTARWEDPPLLCVCRVSLAVPGPGGGYATATVVIVPLHLIGAALLVATLVTGVLVARRRLWPAYRPAHACQRRRWWRPR